jgi:hypothetical protein
VKTIIGIFLVAFTLTAGSSAPEAQQPAKIPRIGFVAGTADA